MVEAAGSTSRTIWFLVGIVLIAPLPLGSNIPWAAALLVTLVAGLAFFVSWFASPPAGTIPWRILGPAIGWLLWVAIANWSCLLTSGSTLVPVAGPDAAVCTTGDPERFLIAVAGVIAFWCSARLVDGPVSRRLVVGGIVVAAALNAAFGLANSFAGGELLSLRIGADSDVAMNGTFVNKNHFGALMALSLPLSLGVLLQRFKLGGTVAIPAIGCALIFFGLIFSASRGAIVATFVVLILGSLWAVVRMRVHRRLALTSLLGFLVVAVLLVSTLPELRSRFTDADISEARVPVWRLAASLIRDRPVVGYGQGNFRWAQVHRKSDADTIAIFDFAHSVPLELLLSAGIVGLALFAWWLFAVYWVAARRASVDGPEMWIRVGLVIGCLGLLLHSLVEFNFQIPALWVTWCIAMGASVGSDGSTHVETSRI